MFPSSLPSVASAPVVHQSPRNVTFHYRRSSAAYFGGMCSVSRGVGVNEVSRCPSSLCLHVSRSPRLCVSTMCFVLFVCLSLSLFPAVRQQLGHGHVPLPEPGPEPGHPVGPGIKEKYPQNTLTGFLLEFWPLVMSQRARLLG